MNEILHNLMQSTDFPLLTAFVLGLLTALNPCQLAISISALAYEYKSGKRFEAGLLYAFGRTITYTLLGWTLMCLMGGGRNIEGIDILLSRAEDFIPYILIALGCIFIIRSFHHHHNHGDSCHNSGQIIKRNGPFGSLILGITLAFAFCPESAVFYFGLMLPLAMTSKASIFIPLIFAIAAAIPVIVIAYIMTTTLDKAKQRISHSFNTFQKILNAITGILFIIIGSLLLLE